MNQNKVKISEFGFDILQIESTAACNMACSFCPYPLKEDKNSKLNLNDIFDLLNSIDLNDKDFKYVTFSQFNEPLLDSRIFEILKFCKEKTIPVLFITNGLLLNKQHNIDNLLKYCSNIKISLQILDSNKHKNARGLNLELERYLTTITNFCFQAKDKKDINITVDLGCNFNDKKIIYFLKKILGIQVGDPSVPKNLNETMKIFSRYAGFFHNISDDNYKKSFEELYRQKENFKSEYLKQDGYKIFSNVILKFKPFLYGRRISEFFPINNNFACESKILAILADGNVVPCCLTYDDTISMGKFKNNNLEEILIKSKNFLNNLRTKKLEKHNLCKKCFGEPTRRGAIVRDIWSYVPLNLKKILKTIGVLG